MTLVLTEISPLGIAMATDSAVTYLDESTGARWVNPDGQQKLHTVPAIQAGVSCWGLGVIDGTQTDTWIDAFIHRTSATDLTSFAAALAADLNRLLGPNGDGRARLGFHVAGYLDDGKGQVPSLYHVHDGPSDVLSARGTGIDLIGSTPTTTVRPSSHARRCHRVKA